MPRFICLNSLKRKCHCLVRVTVKVLFVLICSVLGNYWKMILTLEWGKQRNYIMDSTFTVIKRGRIPYWSLYYDFFFFTEFLAERAEKQLSITISPSLDEICDQKQWHQPWFLDPATALLLGKRRMHRTFLTIGIASVERQERYLEQTLDSLLEKSTDTERENVTLVIFLADMDLNVR